MNKKTILLVDDEPDMLDTISNYLKERGFRAELANNGREAVKLLEKVKPDLIILDIMMPVMNGFEFLHFLKTYPQHADIPVIILSAKHDVKAVDKGIFMEAEFYLPKPFAFDNLMSFINVILKKE